MDLAYLDRRAFLGGALAVAATRLHAQDHLPSLSIAEPRALPTTDQLAWQDLELGMFVHIAPNTWQDKEGDDLSTPLAAIDADFDTENWADCAVQLGARYIVFVAKHEGGFCMWQTETTKYSIAGTPWRGGKGDVMADLAHSCQKRGLRLGVYLSPQDKFAGAGLGGACKTPAAQQAYNATYRQQLTEVLTRYGPMVEVWFDGSSVVPTSDLVKKYASRAAIFQGPDASIRWVGNEMGFAPYPLWNAETEADRHGGVSTAMHGTPAGTAWVPVECDVSIRRPNWFWSTSNENHLMTLDQLLEIYYRSVGRGAQMLLNLPPNRTGRMAAADLERAKEFGDQIRHRFGRSVVETAGRGVHLEMPPLPADRVDHILLQEDCRYGQRVRSFRLEGRVKGEWRALYDGSSIGHKRIVPVEPAQYELLRLVVVVSAGEPRILRFAAFATGVAAPATWDAAPKIWADDAVGEWADGRFSLDLSARIKDATAYRLRFIAKGGQVRQLNDVELLLDNVPAPHLLRTDDNDALILTMTAIGMKVVLRGTVEGAPQGTILFRRL